MSLVVSNQVNLQQSFSLSDPSAPVLPDEIIFNIFSHLGSLDLFRMASICNRWKAISGDELLWKRLYLERKNSLDKPLVDGFTYRMYMRQATYMDHLIQHPHFPKSDLDFYTHPWAFKLDSLMRSKLNLIVPIFYRPRPGSLLFVKCIYREGDLGFFVGDQPYESEINIVSFSRRCILTTIPAWNPLKCFLLPDNRLVIVTESGRVLYWNISNICAPTYIEGYEVINSSEEKLLNVIKIQESLILQSEHHKLDKIPDLSECYIFDLNEKKTRHFTLEGRSILISGGDKTVIRLSPHFFHAYEFSGPCPYPYLKRIWEKVPEEDSLMVKPGDFIVNRPSLEFNYLHHHLHQFDNVNSQHPYLFYKEVNQEKNTSFFTVLNALNGTELLKIDSNLIECGYETFGLIDDIFLVLSDFEINFWILPSCERYTIGKEALPAGFTFKNIAWDGQTLIVQLENESRQTYQINDRVHFLCYDISKKQHQPGLNQTTPLVLPRIYFLEVGLSNLFKTIPMTIWFTLGKIIQLITFSHFRLSPLLYSMPFKTRLLDASYCLLQIVCIPLLVIAKQFAAMWGLVSPSQGDRLITLIDNQTARLNLKTIDWSFVTARC